VSELDSPLQELQRRVQETVSGMSPDLLERRLPGKWCAGEIFEHLYLTYTGTIKGLQRVSDAGAPRVTAPTLTARVRKLVVLGLHYMPTGREAPAFARPRGLSTDVIIAEIVPRIAELDAAITSVEHQLGKGKLLDHPFLGPLSGAEWREFHLVHGLHHLKQIDGLRLPQR